MPNGFHGSLEEWQRLTVPFQRLDPVLEKFAQENGASVRKDYRNTPCRFVEWSGDVHGSVNFLLADEQSLILRVHVAAWRDVAKQRLLKEEVLVHSSTAEGVADGLMELLMRGKKLLQSWTPDDFPRVY